MLHLILGRAKTGKTALVMEAIRRHVEAGEAHTVLLVPEQYSHEAETELLSVCGDGLSLCAEVLSFSRLAARVESETGLRHGKTSLDAGGRLLCLVRALDAAGSRLRVFSAARRQAPLQQALLAAIDECKTCRVSPEALRALSTGEALRDKLEDLALVYEAYEAVAAQSGLDPLDRLTQLAEALPQSSCAAGQFYIDGFTDFTAQERRVISVLLQCGAEVTVCLTCAGPEEDSAVFGPSRRAVEALRREAESLGVSWKLSLRPEPEGEDPMALLERELFSFHEVRCDPGGRIALLRAADVTEECEAAAARCLALARETGCRWRDIAIAAREFETYRAGLETAFALYGVPLSMARASDLLSKPLPALIGSAYAAVTGGWDYDDVLAYLKTGLAGLDRADCDTLENYAFLWSLRGSAFARDEDWALHPGGFGGEFDEDSRRRLEAINVLRRRALSPLWTLAEKSAAAADAAGQAEALADFFDALDLPVLLERRAEELKRMGLRREAAEYVQLWDITVDSLEQCAAVLGTAEMDAETFGQLFLLTLSAHNVDSIPLTLDKVGAGDMGRMRRRHIRHLIVLGCDSETLPRAGAVPGIFTDEDREAIRSAGMELGDTADGRLDREFALLYNCLTLPSDTLTLSWSAAAGDGAQAQPAFVVTRAERLFSLRAAPVDPEACRESAPGPAFTLAAEALSHGGFHTLAQQAALECFRARGAAEDLARLEQAANLTRGRLSPTAVRALYGERPRLSASRIDALSACSFAFFLRYGLRAKPRQAAEFAPPELGTFMHYVLENVAREISDSGGFAKVDADAVEALCDAYVERYIHDKLWDFRQKSPRFVYLFRRLIKDVRAVVTDMVAELRRGDFRPVDFELNFGDREQFPPIRLGDGEEALTLTGVADRVDGWVHDGKLYLRVVDYKTGEKAFSLSDVWYGLGLQMLLYLFALGRAGKNRYGKEIVPAGVLYIPARDVLLSTEGALAPEEILAEKARQLRRSGLVLDDPAVLEAMEHGTAPRYLPVTYNKGGAAAGDCLASAERLGLLSRHVDATLRALAAELRSGSIAADPWFRSQTENACRFCDYAEACHFNEEDDHLRYLTRLRAPQVWEKLAAEVDRK